MKRREAAVPAGPVLPLWLTSFVFADWIDLAEVPPADVRALAVANLESFEIEAAFWRRARALVRWREAAERWCTESGLSYSTTVLGWSCPSAGEVAAGVPPPIDPGRLVDGLAGPGRTPPLSDPTRSAEK